MCVVLQSQMSEIKMRKCERWIEFLFPRFSFRQIVVFLLLILICSRAHTYFSALCNHCNQYLSTHAIVNVPFGCNKIQIKQHKETFTTMIIKSLCYVDDFGTKMNNSLLHLFNNAERKKRKILLSFVHFIQIHVFKAAQWPLNGCCFSMLLFPFSLSASLLRII